MNYVERFNRACEKIRNKNVHEIVTKDHVHKYSLHRTSNGEDIYIASGLTYDEAVYLATKVRKKLSRINELDETGEMLYSITQTKIQEEL